MAAASLDVIIIDSTDPIGPAEGLFSADFYRDCLRALRNGGIAVQQSESPLYHLALIKNMRQAMHTAGFEKMLTLDFPQCTYPSGWWTVTMAGNGAALAATPRDNDALALETRYYNPAIHRAAQSLPNFLKSALDD